MVILSIVYVLNLKTIMHNIVISFSIVQATKIIFCDYITLSSENVIQKFLFYTSFVEKFGFEISHKFCLKYSK